MESKNQVQFNKDLPNKKLTVTRYFDAPQSDVWMAWTEREYLDKWWAPKPWRAETKTMNFTEGGHWFYAMVGPANERHYAMVTFNRIEPKSYFEAQDSFTDENGNPNSDLPSTQWKNRFSPEGNGTMLLVELSFKTEKDLSTLVEMGFQEGFTMTLDSLAEYLAANFSFAKQS
jgi:PhnB protein